MITKNNHKIILLASSRSKGNTYDAVNQVSKKMPENFLDLSEYKISDFDYESKSLGDDFLKIINLILLHKTIVLATPIYWYTMSAGMKRFIDRLTDLLDEKPEIGRTLRGKELAIITSYNVHPEGMDGFETIFINIARYLGMNYKGCYFHYVGNNEKRRDINQQLIGHFIEKFN